MSMGTTIAIAFIDLIALISLVTTISHNSDGEQAMHYSDYLRMTTDYWGKLGARPEMLDRKITEYWSTCNHSTIAQMSEREEQCLQRSGTNKMNGEDRQCVLEEHLTMRGSSSLRCEKLGDVGGEGMWDGVRSLSLLEFQTAEAGRLVQGRRRQRNGGRQNRHGGRGDESEAGARQEAGRRQRERDDRINLRSICQHTSSTRTDQAHDDPFPRSPHPRNTVLPPQASLACVKLVQVAHAPADRNNGPTGVQERRRAQSVKFEFLRAQRRRVESPWR
ncbi:hypothetical protein DFH07DRAFT_782773 [Mycena maculata]|uniref:Uncharacterized protein n=1 Tax=Mycena maculata TaxID=230809 RepID=A0AAD7HR44_9AGAR|nr:hypothetical protein DFH07DRAFT_782773 [Mycena maculata]